MLQRMTPIKNFTPNFKGNAIPVKGYSEDEYARLVLKFDPSNNYGDSLNVANALFKDLKSEGAFEADEPQRLVSKDNQSVYFDSRLSEVHLSTSKMNPSLTCSFRTEHYLLDEETGELRKVPKVDFISHGYNRFKIEYENTAGAIKNILERFVINEHKIVDKNHPNKEQIVPAALTLLKKLTKNS